MTYCIANESAGYIYVNMAKAACSSIKEAIAAHKGVDFETLTWKHPHRRHLSYARDRSDLYRFTFVRHPAARLVSCWADWCQPPYPDRGNYDKNPALARLRGIDFPTFIHHVCDQVDGQRNEHYAIQWRQLFSHGSVVVDDAFKVRELSVTWAMLQERFGLPDLPHVRRSEHGPWQDYFDDELEALVLHHYHEDFANLGFEWEVSDAECAHIRSLVLEKGSHVQDLRKAVSSEIPKR